MSGLLYCPLFLGMECNVSKITFNCRWTQGQNLGRCARDLLCINRQNQTCNCGIH